MVSVFSKLRRDDSENDTRKKNRETLETVRQMFWDLRKILVWTGYSLEVQIFNDSARLPVQTETVAREEIERYYGRMDSLLESIVGADRSMKRSLRELKFALQQHKERLLRLEPGDERSKMELYLAVKEVVNALNEARNEAGETDMDFAWG